MVNSLQNFSSFLVLPMLSCFLTIIFTKISISVLTTCGISSETGGRHINKESVPVGGGIAFILAIVISMVVLYYSPWRETLNKYSEYDSFSQLVKVGIPLLLLIPIGILDDVYKLRARYKLLAQLCTALICWSLGIEFNSVIGYQLPLGINLTMTIIWIVGFINAFNLIDGLDGLAAGISIISSICLSVILFLNHNYLFAILLLCLCTSCLGFLRYNFHPAKIFMGDTGSMFLGYMFATVGIVSSTKTASFSAVTIPILACGVPLIDTILAIWRRVTFKMLDKQKNNGNGGVMNADKDHLHHRILEINKSQSKTAWAIYIVAVILGVSGILLYLVSVREKIPGFAFIILLLVFVVFIQKFAAIEIWNSTRLIFEGLKQPRKSILVNMLHPLWDLAVVIGSTALTFIMLQVYNHTDSPIYVATIAFISPVIVLLALTRNYRVFWLRTEMNDYVLLFRTLTIAYLVVFIINVLLIKKIDLILLTPLCLFIYLMVSLGILGERVALKWLQTALVRHFHESKLNETSVPAVLYGGGLCAYIYIIRKYSYISEEPVRIVGIIDDDPALIGNVVYSYKVLGQLKDIERIHQKNPFRKVIICTSLNGNGKKGTLMEFCKKNNIEVIEMEIRENKLNKS